MEKKFPEIFRKAFEAGNESGLYDALVYCREEKVPVPGWVLGAAIERQHDFILGTNKRRAKWLRRFRQDMIDMRRALEVDDFRVSEKEGGVQWKVVYEVVGYVLKEASGIDTAGPEAIKKSYKRYKQTMKTDPYRYYVPRYLQYK